MSAPWSSLRHRWRIGALVLLAIVAISSLTLWWRWPVVIHEKALPEHLAWEGRRVSATQPGSIVLVGKLNGLSEIWVRLAGPAAAGSVIGVLRPTGGGEAHRSAGEPVSRDGQRFLRFAFPPVADSAGERFYFELRRSPTDLSALDVVVAEAPGRFYPADDSPAPRQIGFELWYATTNGDALVSLAGRLGAVTAERWAPAPLVLVLAIVQVGLIAALFRLVWRAWSWV